jgi:hypothetical protein
MRYDQLEHAIRAACDVSGDTELLIFGGCDPYFESICTKNPGQHKHRPMIFPRKSFQARAIKGLAV